MNSRTAILVAASVFATTLVVGCAGDPTNEEAVGDVEQKWSPPIVAGNCPDPAMGSTEKNEYYQGKATTVIQYLVGGKEPFTSDELSTIPACKDAFTSLTNLRNMVTPPTSRDKGGASLATLSLATAGTACGLSAAMYTIDFSSQVPLSVWAEQQKVGEQLDKCWGYGVSGFYFAGDTSGSGGDNKTPVVHHVYIDPEPARLTKDLFGLTGATAAAIYENTGAETGVLKYPGGWVNPPSPPTPGQPCSTTDLANGSETLKILQGSGTWRRCW